MDADAPKCIRKLLSNILALPDSSITIKVTNKRVNGFGGYGLAILMPYSDFFPQKVVARIKRHIVTEFEIIKNGTERCMK